jgi:23S rRNA pseudouridine1911/1915/1917 synthase
LTQDSFIIIPEQISHQKRLDRVLMQRFPEMSRSHLQVLIATGAVAVNGKQVKSGYHLKPGDRIDVTFPEPQASEIVPENIPLNIVYEDRALLVINKPAGLVVHPGAGNRSGTLVNALLFHCKSLSGINGILRPGIVHRLDKNTSGLMVVAKNDGSHRHLARQFETREIIRTYQALVWGEPEDGAGEISTLIDRKASDRKKMSVSTGRGRPAVTTFHIVKKYLYFTMLDLQLRTGRTHQIRVHLKHIHHPVFGDPEYDGRRSQLGRIPSVDRIYVISLLEKLDRQALHARRLSFIHPLSEKRISFDSALPEDISAVIASLREV